MGRWDRRPPTASGAATPTAKTRRHAACAAPRVATSRDATGRRLTADAAPRSRLPRVRECYTGSRDWLRSDYDLHHRISDWIALTPAREKTRAFNRGLLFKDGANNKYFEHTFESCFHGKQWIADLDGILQFGPINSGSSEKKNSCACGN